MTACFYDQEDYLRPLVLWSFIFVTKSYEVQYLWRPAGETVASADTGYTGQVK